MKVKTVTTAMLFIFISQPVFGWVREPPEIVWRGGWISIQNPVTPLPIPIYLPYRARSVHQLENRPDIRDSQILVRARDPYADHFKALSKKTVRIRRPKR